MNNLEWMDKKGYWHREDGPAYISHCGDLYWYNHGQYHREDGPAIEECNGRKEWWYYGQRLDCESQEEFERLIKLELFW